MLQQTNVVMAMKNSGESKNYLKQVAQSPGQISNNMPDESHDEILQQMCYKMTEVLKAIQSGNTMIAHFASAKSLAEELIQIVIPPYTATTVKPVLQYVYVGY